MHTHTFAIPPIAGRRTAVGRTFSVLVLALLAFAPALPVGAGQDLSPSALVDKIAREVLDAIRSDADLRAGDRAKALALAEQKVLPLVDFHRMTRLAVGRAWRGASAAQQDTLATEFRAMLIRTYSSAISAYGGQTMQVDANPSGDPASGEAKVRARYVKPGSPAVPVEYAMWKSPEGWKVYDIVVDGVSLVTTYRSTFDEEIRTGGLDGLITRLRDKNQEASQSGR